MSPGNVARAPKARRRRLLLVAGLLLLGALEGIVPVARFISDGLRRDAGAAKARALRDLANLPLRFEENHGQSDADVRFLSRGPSYRVFLTSKEAVFAFDDSPEAGVVRMGLVAAAPSPTVEGVDRLRGRVNYILGDDPSSWHTGVPTFGRVAYRAVYPGIDLVYYGRDQVLEYDFEVAPGADPSIIGLSFEGAEKVTIDERGDLLVSVDGGGTLRQGRPTVYQPVGNRRHSVDGGFLLRDNGQVGFRLAGYDARRPLVIDPQIGYSTHFGSTGGDPSDSGEGVAVDPSGAAYVTGTVRGASIPTKSPSGTPFLATRPSPSNGGHAFVAKFDTTQSGGNSLVYSTFLGGAGANGGEGSLGHAIAVDGAGNAYVTGRTDAPSFPKHNGFAASNGGGFVTVLNPTGSGLVYSTSLGPGNLTSDLFPRGIAVGGASSVYVTGSVPEAGQILPKQARQPLHGGGGMDAFVAKVDPTRPGAASLEWATYLGGPGRDEGVGIAVDGAGNAYVSGSTTSHGLATAGAFQTAAPGSDNGFVAKLSSDGRTLGYLTYLGGADSDDARGIAVDSAGTVYLTGTTLSVDFPTGARQGNTGAPGAYDAYVAVLNSQGSTLDYTARLGVGNGLALALRSSGEAREVYVTGYTRTAAFTVKDPFQVYGGLTDAFVAQLDPAKSGLDSVVYSSFLGGESDDSGSAIAVDSTGAAYVVGDTFSRLFPSKNAFSGYGSSRDAFLSKIVPNPLLPTTTLPPVTLPGVTLPGVTLPTVSLPTTTLPDTTLPTTTLPPTSVPDTTLPPTSLPQTTLPPTSLPPTTLPDLGTVPTVPNATVPSATVPSATVPTVPSATVPNATVPNATVPSATVPNATVPTVPSATVPSATVPNSGPVPTVPNATVPNLGPAPTVPNVGPAPTVPNVGPAPTVPNLGPAPTVPNLGPAPTVPNVGPAPTVPNVGPAPTVPNLGPAPTAPNLGPAPTGPNVGSAPTAPVVGQTPTFTPDVSGPTAINPGGTGGGVLTDTSALVPDGGAAPTAGPAASAADPGLSPGVAAPLQPSAGGGLVSGGTASPPAAPGGTVFDPVRAAAPSDATRGAVPSLAAPPPPLAGAPGQIAPQSAGANAAAGDDGGDDDSTEATRYAMVGHRGGGVGAAEWSTVGVVFVLACLVLRRQPRPAFQLG